MPNKDPNFQVHLVDWLFLAIAVLFAMVGGVTKHLADKNEAKEKITLSGLFTQAFISGFTGSITTLYLIELEFSFLMTLIGAGLSGFAGVALIRLVMRVIYNRFGLINSNHAKGGDDEASKL